MDMFGLNIDQVYILSCSKINDPLELMNCMGVRWIPFHVLFGGGGNEPI